MAYDNRTQVYLGYEDEYVTEKNRSLVNFTTNKIGGYPNWHSKDALSPPRCKLCGLYQLLTLQLYAPLENSNYHRTLYIFACVNSNCWNQNDGWTCRRVQSLENTAKVNTPENGTCNVPLTTTWLSSADDWDDDTNDNSSEQNGNDPPVDQITELKLSARHDIGEDLNDEISPVRVDDLNANSPVSIESPIGGGATGRLESPQAIAEIDGEEREVVCIDTPTRPQQDLVNLLQEVTPFPVQIEPDVSRKFTFAEIFLSVEEEDTSMEVPQHVRDLLLEYKHSNSELLPHFTSEAADSKSMEVDTEKYEKGVPKHGDESFHNFICKIQNNPGQLVRYSRSNSAQILLSPLNVPVGKCNYCGGNMIFELQVLPTLIPKLILCPRTQREFQIEFGTVLIYTCLNSCWSSTDVYKEEQTIVQAERF